MRSRTVFPSALLAVLLGAAIGCDPPLPPPEPTWRHVEPLLRAHCNHCHGASAERTGSADGVTYRFDFYDLDPAMCGEAAAALPAPAGLAKSWAQLIKSSVTRADGGRPRMPPAPAAALADWERETLVRWADLQAPRGTPRESNRPPVIRVETGQAANKRVALKATVADPDGESVIGLLRVGGVELRMDRAGSFATTLDVSGWPDGSYPIGVVLCDGWSASRQAVGAIQLGTPPVLADAGVDAGASDGPLVVDARPPEAGALPDGGGLEAPPPPPRCPDLDGNAKLDCDETLLVNAGFDQDLRGWMAETNSAQTYAPRDGQGRLDSGAIAVTNAIMADAMGGTLGGSVQCLDAMGGKRYLARAQVLVEAGQAGQAASDPLRAGGVNVRFWSAPGCVGDLVGAFTTSLAPELPADAWRTVGGSAAAPANARSMAVRLVAAKSFRQPPFRVLIDNVLIRPE